MVEQFDAKNYFQGLDKDLQDKIRKAFYDSPFDDDEFFGYLADLKAENLLTTPEGNHYLGKLPIPSTQGDRVHFYVGADGKGGLEAKCLENETSVEVIREPADCEMPNDNYFLSLSQEMYDKILSSVNNQAKCLVEEECSTGCGGTSFEQCVWGPDGQFLCSR